MMDEMRKEGREGVREREGGMGSWCFDGLTDGDGDGDGDARGALLGLCHDPLHTENLTRSRHGRGMNE